MEITTTNTNRLAPIVYDALRRNGVPDTSRNGPVLRFEEPVTVCLTRPWERVNFCHLRDANPFFHLIEAMAMLGAMNSVKLMAHFAKNMGSYTDDGETFNAFYGTRAREYDIGENQTLDQIQGVVDELHLHPDSRQAVVQLWDPRDQAKVTRDKACNLTMLFFIRHGCLCLTTFNRSNDAIFGGVTGANIVHLSMFQELVACALGIPMGSWWHTSNNLHVYTENPKWSAVTRLLDVPVPEYPHLSSQSRLFDRPEELYPFQTQLVSFLDEALARVDDCSRITASYGLPFLDDVVRPVFNSWQMHKAGESIAALFSTTEIQALDWQVACSEWLHRRIQPKAK